MPQLVALVQRLAGPESYFFIGIDKRSSAITGESLEPLDALANVHVYRDIPIHWGGYSHLDRIITLIAKAFSKGTYDYFHTLSGQCFPAMPLGSLDAFFERNKGREFLHNMELPTPVWNGGGLDRLSLFHLNDILDPKRRLFKRINPVFLSLQKKLGVSRGFSKNFPRLYGGGTWWSLTAAAVMHVMDVLENTPVIQRQLRHTNCAEEVLFQTVVMNSSFKEAVVNNDLRYIDWGYRNGSCPAFLDSGDYDAIIKSGKLFARKLDSTISRELILRLSEL